MDDDSDNSVARLTDQIVTIVRGRAAKRIPAPYEWKKKIRMNLVNKTAIKYPYIPEFVAEVFNGVYTDESSHKKTDRFHAENSQY